MTHPPSIQPANHPLTRAAAADGVQRIHQAALDQGRLLIQRCAGCGKHVYFPRESCPHCGSAELGWVAPAGGGTIYAVTTVRRKADAGGDYNVSLIDLDEGVRMMSRVENMKLQEVQIGQRVHARVQLVEGHGLVVFDAMPEPASPAGVAA